MYRLLILTICILYSMLIWAKPNYQVDLIFFKHPQSELKDNASDLNWPLVSSANHAIMLKSYSGKLSPAYTLLPTSQSGLRNEYYLLSHKSGYQTIGQYSWIQPATNQSSIAFPDMNLNDWIIQGTLRIRQSNYYLLDSDVQISSKNNTQTSFYIKQKQRLKGNTVYYIDHPQVGMLVKIHQLTS